MPHLEQNVTLLRTETTEDNEKTGSSASAKTAGVVSIVMVSHSNLQYAHKPEFPTHIKVCETDDSCIGFPLRGQPTSDDDRVGNMTCYKGGETVFNNHQMCDVTSTFPTRVPMSNALTDSV